MKPLIRYSGILALILALLLPSCGSEARDLDQDEALRLREAGIIQPFDRLWSAVMARYPGSRLLEVELEDEKGIYADEVELITPAGVVRELELDARDGRIRKDEED